MTEVGATAEPAFPRGGGEAGSLVRGFDWSRTSLGPIAGWPAGLKALVDLVINSPIPMVLMWGADHVMIYNDGYALIAGARHPAALGGAVPDIWPEIWDWNRSILEAGFRGEMLTYRDQTMTVERSGAPEEVVFDLFYSPVRNDGGSVTGVLCTVIETTERALADRRRAAAETELRQLNETLAAERRRVEEANLELVEESGFLRSLFQQAPGFMTVLRGPDHVFELANPRYLALVGNRDIVGKPLREALPEIAEQGFLAVLDGVYESGRTYVGTGVHVLLQRQPDRPPEERILDFVYQPIQARDGSVTGIFVEGNDVTERFIAAERLRIAQTAGRIGAFEWSPETGRLDASEEYLRIYGLPPGRKIDQDMLVSLVHPDDRAATGPSRLETDNPLSYAEYRITRPDTGEVRWIARRGEMLPSDGKAPKRYVGVAFDITERKLAEGALVESESRFRLMADSAPALIWATDEEGRIVFANRRYERDFGLPPDRVLGAGWQQILHKDDAEAFETAFQAAIAARGEFRRDVRAWDKRGRLRWLRCEGVPRFGAAGVFLGYVGCNVDITEAKLVADDLEAEVEARSHDLRATEEALRQAQKMEAVGQLTGGIAHDFNNLLTGIVGSLDLMQTRIAQGRMEGLDRYVSAATTSANRAAALTHRLLAFARRQPLDPKPVAVNVLVASMDELLRRTLGEAVHLEIVAAGGLWLTLCDPNQLESAILNLAINARDAMPGGGRLTIETANAHLDDAYAAAQRDVEPGQYVAICVTDTGTGMPPEVIARAFDPFFTTKPIGQGTGLGLSMVYGFGKQSNGHIRIHSEVGEGTTVKLYLPRHFGTAAEERAAESFEAQLSAADETVLVVEDEPVVRNLVVEVVEDLGYRAVEAIDGPSGLAILESDQQIDLLVSDIGLPGLNGRQLADRARAVRPDLKVLFMTGYAENAAVAQGFLDPGMEMITKPFAVDLLAKRIRSMIGER